MDIKQLIETNRIVAIQVLITSKELRDKVIDLTNDNLPVKSEGYYSAKEYNEAQKKALLQIAEEL